MAKPDKAPIATAPPTPASTGSRRLWPRRRSRRPRRPPRKWSSRIRRQLRHCRPPGLRPIRRRLRLRRRSRTQRGRRLCRANSAEPSTPKIDSKKKPPEKPSAQKPAKSAKASEKSVASGRATIDRSRRRRKKRSDRLSPRKAPAPPTAVAPVKAPSVQQRVADGMTHAFGYLVHLPGALVPHFGGSNPDAH